MAKMLSNALQIIAFNCSLHTWQALSLDSDSILYDAAPNRAMKTVKVRVKKGTRVEALKIPIPSDSNLLRYQHLIKLYE
jgi:hypothetical protein